MNSALIDLKRCLSDALAEPIYSFEQWLSMHHGTSAVDATCFEDIFCDIELRSIALKILALKEPIDKLQALRTVYPLTLKGRVGLDAQRDWNGDTLFEQHCPGVPIKPVLVHAVAAPKRSLNTIDGLAVTVHALAHIEFNAINLALDAMVRFAGLSDDYYWDWWRVAAEEAYHFSLIERHLNHLGAQYGDYPAHSGLWDMAKRTRHSLADRMAMVPRTLEARGLDACPIMQEKFRQAGDEQAAQILDVILHDEITHVALGHRWFIYACAQNQHEPILEYRRIAQRLSAPRMRPPFNIPARRAAGFFEEELSAWQNEL